MAIDTALPVRPDVVTMALEVSMSGGPAGPLLGEPPAARIEPVVIPPPVGVVLADHRRGPRRRGAALERAIFDAVLLELAEYGYDTLSFDSVALRAHTGKSALYRRWTTKRALVLDALSRAIPSGPSAVPRTGTLRGDLVAVLTQYAERLAGPEGGAMRALLPQRNLYPELFDEIRRRVAEPRRRVLVAVLWAGIMRGDVRADAVQPEVLRVGPTMVTFRYLETGRPPTAEDVAAIVDRVLIPLLAPR